MDQNHHEKHALTDKLEPFSLSLLPTGVQCRVRKGAGSQSVVRYVSTISGSSISKALIRASAELSAAAQLCVFILGMLSLCLGYGCVAYVLVSSKLLDEEFRAFISARFKSFLSRHRWILLYPSML